jgi:hypothetical protein
VQSTKKKKKGETIQEGHQQTETERREKRKHKETTRKKKHTHAHTHTHTIMLMRRRCRAEREAKRGGEQIKGAKECRTQENRKYGHQKGKPMKHTKKGYKGNQTKCHVTAHWNGTSSPPVVC